MDNGKWLLYWRLSATSGGLARGHFFARGLPPPGFTRFRSYSELAPQSQGGQARQGYQNLEVRWEFLDFSQLKTLGDIVEASLTAGGTIYITFDRGDGTKLLNDFVDGNGIVLPLEYQEAGNSRGLGVQNVKMAINNVAITGDPSTVL